MAGEWKGFVFRVIQKVDEPKVYEHLRKSFYEDELVCRYYGGNDELCAREFETLYSAIILDNLSILAEDIESHEIAGVLITMNQKQNFRWNKFNFQSRQASALFRVIQLVDDEADLMKDFPTKLANFIAASVDRKYREKGLLTEMYRRSKLMLKEKEFDMVKSVLTSPFSRKALRTLGFRESGRIHFIDLQWEEGEKMFPNLPDGIFSSFMYDVINPNSE